LRSISNEVEKNAIVTEMIHLQNNIHGARLKTYIYIYIGMHFELHPTLVLEDIIYSRFLLTKIQMTVSIRTPQLRIIYV